MRSYLFEETTWTFNIDIGSIFIFRVEEARCVEGAEITHPWMRKSDALANEDADIAPAKSPYEETREASEFST